MKFICPLITVRDIQLSRHFYEMVLAQEVILDHGENITFKGDFAIHLESHYQKLIGNKTILRGGHDFELYFEEDDLEPIIKKLQDYGVEWVHELKEQPWRQRVIRFYDPDQHIIEIGESMEFLCFRLYQEGLTKAEISKATGLDSSMVKNYMSKNEK